MFRMSYALTSCCGACEQRMRCPWLALLAVVAETVYQGTHSTQSVEHVAERALMCTPEHRATVYTCKHRMVSIAVSPRLWTALSRRFFPTYLMSLH
jgi:hypothetical protein